MHKTAKAKTNKSSQFTILNSGFRVTRSGKNSSVSHHMGSNGRNPYIRRNELYRRAFQANIDQFQHTFNKQEPHTIWIDCSDSHIPPELVIDALPGELFVMRNIGNIIPPPDGVDKADACTTAHLVYALDHLTSIRNIVICGHTDCGAMATLARSAYRDLEPELAQWLIYAQPVRDRVLAGAVKPSLLTALAEENVVHQIEQLYCYESVVRRLRAGALNIYGLIYDDTNGGLRELACVETTGVEMIQIPMQATPAVFETCLS
jgi:carbonic anhydrase